MSRASGLSRQRRELTKLWLTYRLPLIAAVALIAVVVGSKVAIDDHLAASAEARRAALDRAARGASKAVAGRISQLLERLDAAPDGAALNAALESGDPARVDAVAKELAASEADVLRVWILPPGYDQPDYGSTPPLGYAAIDLARRSAASDKPLGPEAILFGKPGEHVALARGLRGADGRLVGQLLWAVDARVVKTALAGVDTANGYAEVTQRVPKGPALVLARAGEPAARQGNAVLSLGVSGTRWRVGYWPAMVAGDADGLAVPPWMAALAGVLALALIGALVVWRRRKVRALAEIDGEPPPVFVPPVVEGGASGDDAGEPVAPASATAVEVETVAEEGAAEGALPESIFRAYDVRGVVGATLTVDVVRRIGQAIGSEAFARGQQTVVVGCDGRVSSPELSDALIEGLRHAGRDVIDVGRVPTPVLYFATHFFDTGSGVMVTGSHNPPNYNGLKIMLAGDTLFGDDIQALRARADAGDLTTGGGSLQSMEIVDDYVRRVTEDVPVALGSSFKVVVDCGNGIAGEVAPKLIRALGHDVVELFCEVDGRFPNHHPDPSDPANLVALIEQVRETGAALGLAFDGDGDRLGVVDPAGNIIWPDRQMMLFARDVLSRNPGAEIVFDVKCSSRLPRVIAKLGGKPVMWKTGHSFIKDKLKESGAPIAGEMSGHIFFKERWYGFDDGIYAAARLLEILTGFKHPPVEVFAKLPDGVSTPELRVDLEEGAQIEFMQRLLETASFEDGKVTTIDGLRVDFADSWGLVRASNTTPSLVLRFEADAAAALERVEERFRTALLAVDPDLALPF